MLYTILLLFLVLLVGILGILGTRKVILDKMKAEIAFTINGINKIYLHLEYENPLVANTSMVDGFTFDPLDIVKIVDQAGNKVEGSIRYDSKPSFDSTKNGVYTVIYTGSYQGKEVTKTTTIEIINPVSHEYVYTGVEERFETPVKGLYQFELWGSSGTATYGGTAGKGAYTRGNIPLEKNVPLYIQVGGVSGYNGGGNSSYVTSAPRGGGATDIRTISSDKLAFMEVTSATECKNSGGVMCVKASNHAATSSITLNKGGVIYGPYKTYKAGVYLITFTGYNLHLGTYRPYIAKESWSQGDYRFSFTPVTQLDTTYQYLLYLEKDYDMVEFYMINNSDTPITVESVTVEDVGSRIMVASGGGGAERVTGGDGGTLTGLQSTAMHESTQTSNGSGGSQTTGGVKGTGSAAKYTYGQNGNFGVGGAGATIGYDQAGGGGGGYYGGGGISYAGSGGGGSSFISGYPGCNAIEEIPDISAIRHSNQPNHYSGYVFSNSVMKAGNESMPNYYHTGTMVGNNGNGHAVVTPLIMNKAVVARNLVTNGGFEEKINYWLSWVSNVNSSLSKGNSLVGFPHVHSGSTALHLTDDDDTTNPTWQYNKLNATFSPQDKLYIQSSVHIISNINGDIGVGITYYEPGFGGYGIVTLEGQNLRTPSTNDFIRYSRIQQVTDQLELYAQIGIGKVGEAYIDDIIVLNLTEIFGSGNEPNKEWCDQNIQYFDGTWIIPKR